MQNLDTERSKNMMLFLIAGNLEVGIYKRKEESKNTRKQELDQESDKKRRKQELDQESDQEKKKKLFFFLDHFLGRVLVFLFS